jgi:CoA:oxalate CoA-transferase
LKDDARSVDGQARGSHKDLIRPVIEAGLADKTRAEAVELLEQQGVPSGPVYTAEDVFSDPHISAREMPV